MHKIIFLDIDGVLKEVVSLERDEFGPIFHKPFINNLKSIIDQTDAKIVISSSWRRKGIDFIKTMWKHRNMPGEILDITPLDIIKDNGQRGYEIQKWMDNKKDEVISYCIIDDDYDLLPHQIVYFVQTSGNESHIDNVDNGYGLTYECSLKVVSILNKNL